jgi:two-component system sporulation sensor kinase A
LKSQHKVECRPEAVVDLSERKPIRVLHVDDELGLLKVAKQCLEMQGHFQVDTASSVEEALNKLKEKEYDAVVSDYKMPGKDGLEFLKQLRKEGNDIPFIILTGKGREEVAIKALNLGADRYLDKTSDPETVYCELAYATRQAVDRRSAQIELLKREAKLNAILESSPEAITITDLDGNIVECNQATVDLHGGQSKEDLTGRNALEFIAEKDHEKAIQNLKKTIKQGSVKTVEYTLRTEDGREFPGELSASAVRDASGKPEYLVAITRDITERKKAKEALRETKEYLDNLLNYANAPIIVWDNKQKISLFNNAFEALTGHKKESVLGRNIDVLFPPLQKTEIMQTIEKATQGDRWQSVEVPILCKDEETRVALWNSANIQDKQGNMVATIAQGQDITERKKAEEALRKSEEKWRSLAENAPNVIMIVDRSGTIQFINRTVVEARPEEIAGKTVYDFVGPQHHSIVKKIIEQVFQTGVGGRYEISGIGPKDSVAWYETHVGPIKHDGQTVAVTLINTDLTERKKAEAELRRLATIVTDSNDAITVVDVNGRITAWNKGAESAYGYRKDEALGMDVFKIVPEEKKQETMEVIGKIKMNETVGSFETKRLAKDGRVLDVWLTATKLVDDEGNAVALAITERDITEKKHLEERVHLSEKFTFLGQLASSVAHEIRNPLGVIKNSVYFLNVRLKEHADEKVVKHLRIMEENVNSADRTIRDLLDLGRNQMGSLEPVDLSRILIRAFANLSVPENIKVITKLEKVPKMLLDSERIQRVFVNIIQNAVAAMPEGGTLIVGISRFGDSVEISFKDSGVGIPEENMQKLFTPLFTTKTKGLGLGLVICKQIVEGHRGDIKVESKAGKGASFIIRLPILSRAELVKTGLLDTDLLTGGMSE